MLKLLLLIVVSLLINGWAFMLGVGILGLSLSYANSILAAALLRFALNASVHDK